MKNLFTYKNNIASGLKRYGKFLLLAISLLFVSNTAWAAAPSTLWIRYYQNEGNQLPSTITSSDFTWMQLTSIGDNKWKSEEITLNTKNLNLFFGTSNNTNNLFNSNIESQLVEFQPACATSAQVAEYYGLEKLYIGKSDGDPECTIQIIIKYIDDTHYEIQFDSPCIETDPSVTTGTGTRNGSNQLVISGNVLDELYKDNNCNRDLERLGVQILGTDKTSDKGYYLFSKGNNELWTDYRGEEYTVTYPGTEEVCYRAFANYGNHYGYGDIKCTNETPALSFALIGTMNGSTTSTYAAGTKLTEESANVYTATVTLTQANPVLKVIDNSNSSKIWARDSGKTIEAVGTPGDTYAENATMTKDQTSSGATLSAASGKTIKITFTKTSDTAGSLTFTIQPDPSGTTPSIRIGKQPVVSNLTDVAMNFQIADWGCTTVNTIKVYYTRTDAGTPNNTEPTTESDVWEFNTAIDNNGNIDLDKEDLPSGNYNIKAVACNASGYGDLSDMASFSIYCEQPDQPALSATNGTICPGANITLQITNYASELTYKVVKGTEDTDVAIDNDGNFTLTQGGTYVVKVKNDCSDFVSSSNIVITENEKPEAPTFYNSNRESCTLQNVSFKIAKGNNVIITMNEGTTTTAPAPVDGNVYEGTTVPATISNDLALVENLAVNPTKDYTLTCYQYNTANLCYSEPVTFYIPKNLAIITEVEVSNVTRITADVTVTANAGPVVGTAVAELYLEWRVKGSGDAWTGGSPNIVANPVYQITMLTEGTTYEVRAKAKNNSGCDGNGFGYSEIEEFTTKTCPVLTPQNVTGVNTIGKVQATITMESSETNAEYQLYIEDTPIDGTLQDGTGSALTWQVNQTGLYYVKGWFKEAPYYCTNAPTIMGQYNLDCVQAATPVISIDKNVICSNDAVGATISVTEVANVTYKLYKDGEEQNNTLTDSEFTGLTAAGNYTVVATENNCQTTATSQIITLTVIDANASVTINPTTDTTTPWVPVNFTVTSTAGAPYTLVYKDAAGNDVTDQMVVVKKGNSYSLKIPRPEDWGKGNSPEPSPDPNDPGVTTTYTVEASLEGQASCGSTSTLTITLNDTFEICE